MPPRPVYARPWFLLLALIATGALLLLPGLGSFGLWEPPDSWESVVRRGTDGEGTLSQKQRKRLSRPRSEILLAEQARRALPGEAGALPGARGQGADATKAAKAKAGDSVAELPARPPLPQAVITLGYRIFGVSDWAGRLPLALTALLVLALTFLLLWRLFDVWVGLLGGLVLLGLPGFALQARQLTSEVVPVACGVLAVCGLGLWVAPTVRRPWWALGLGLVGLVAGYYARGAVLGMLVPSLGVLLAMLAGRHLYGVGEASPAPAPGPGRHLYGVGEASPAPAPGQGDEPHGQAGEPGSEDAAASGAGTADSNPRETPDVAAPAEPDTLLAPAPAGLHLRFWLEGAALFALVAGLGVAAWAVLAGQGGPRYSAFLGETPVAAGQVLNFLEMKANPVELAVFDVLLKQIGYGGFPWVALLPLALVAILWWRPAVATLGQGAGGAPLGPAALEAARRDAFGRLLLAGWLISAFLVGTYWVLRFGDAGFLAMPALAGALAVLLRDLGREENAAPRRLAAVAMAIAVLAILLRDFGDYPEALVSTHVHYQLHWPEGLSLKWLGRIVVFFFGVAVAALLVSRGAEPPVAWPRSPGRWLVGSGVGLGRWLGFHAEGEPQPLQLGEVIKAVVVLVLLAVTGGGVAWIASRPPHQTLPIVLGAILVPLTLPLAPLALMTLVDPVLYGLHVLWLLTTGRLFEEPGQLVPEGEGAILWALWRRYTGLHPALVAVFALPMVGVAALTLGRFFLRVGVGVVVLLGGLPLVLWSALRLRWARARSFGLHQVGVWTLVAVPLGLSAWLGWGLVPKLSHHYAYKAIFDTYNASRDPKQPQPLALWQVATRSPVFYTRGPLLGESDLRRRYPAKAGASSLVQYLASGWTGPKGAAHERVYAIVPAGLLGTLDRDTAAQEPRVPYYVLDNRNSFYLLLSNRLGKVKRGGRLVAEKDQNPLRRVVMDQEPSMACPAGGAEVCRRLSVTLSEQKGASAPSLEVIGARFPRVIPAGRSFAITLYFRVLQKIRGNYKVFIHIDGMGNRVIGDHDPVDGRYGTSLWLPGRWVVDRHELPSTATSAVSTPSGWYTIYAGLFQGDRRMQVLKGQADRENRIILGRVRVGTLGAGCNR